GKGPQAVALLALSRRAPIQHTNRSRLLARQGKRRRIISLTGRDTENLMSVGLVPVCSSSFRSVPPPRRTVFDSRSAPARQGCAIGSTDFIPLGRGSALDRVSRKALFRSGLGNR